MYQHVFIIKQHRAAVDYVLDHGHVLSAVLVSKCYNGSEPCRLEHFSQYIDSVVVCVLMKYRKKGSLNCITKLFQE